MYPVICSDLAGAGLESPPINLLDGQAPASHRSAACPRNEH